MEGAEEGTTTPSHAASISAFAREHPGLLLSGGYLAATGVGMLSSWTYYSRFGIDIFAYAQLSDFLIAAVRNPMATLAILVAIPAVWLVMVSDAWFDRRYSWYRYLYLTDGLRRMSRSTPALVIYFILYAFIFAVLYSGRMEDRVRNGAAPRVQVQLQSGTYQGRDGSQPFAAYLLGSTASFVFLYDAGSAEVTAVPLENLARITKR
ncbi:MAG: hypothetical protein HKN72_14785 [Gemmatimonadetes bacterium]|nr:hypothetical protein [Gemmatimonadota bacterium]